MRFFKNKGYKSAEELLAAVELHMRVLSAFPTWTTGTTHDPALRFEDLDEPSFWCQWEAASKEVAGAVKSNLVGRGMKLDPHDEPGCILYIY